MQIFNKRKAKKKSTKKRTRAKVNVVVVTPTPAGASPLDELEAMLPPSLRLRGVDTKLKPEEQAFVLFYCLYRNASAAAYAAGIDAPTAKKKRSNIASDLLKRPDIIDAIEARASWVRTRADVNHERITTMMLDVYEAAFERGQLGIAQRVLFDLAKLHGLVVERSAVLTADISNMSEEQIKEMLGDKYNPKIVADITARLDADEK